MKKSSVGLWIVVGAQALVLLFAFVERRERNYHSTDSPRKHAFSDLNGGLKIILKMFKEDNGRYPTTAEGLKLLVEFPKEGSLANWKGPYFDPPKVPRDPWGHEYIYRCPALYSTNGYDLYSKGPDGVSETSDDIGNWLNLNARAVPTFSPARPVFKINFFQIACEFVIFIPIFFVFRIIGGFMSREFQTLMEENPMADMVWFAISIFAVMFFLTPPVAGR